MGKTYEALEKAENEGRGKNLGNSVPASQNHTLLPAISSHRPLMLEWFEDLTSKIVVQQPEARKKALLFVGTNHGVGCSTITTNYAMALAKNKSLKVLIVDINLRTPAMHNVFKIDSSRGVAELLNGDNEIDTKIRKVGPENLCVLPCGAHHFSPSSQIGSYGFDRIIKLVNGSFDYILFDGPPVPAFSDCSILFPKVDGVVLVIESGKTRRQVALRAKKVIEQAGGKILGVILNKRKHYIPDWLYRRL